MHGLNPIVHSIGWRDTKSAFNIKLDEFLKLIDKQLEKGDTVSLVV